MHPLACMPAPPEDFDGLRSLSPTPTRIDDLNVHMPFTILPEQDWSFLKPGETGWMGPMPDLKLPVGAHFERNARGMLVFNEMFLIARVGRFLRFRRLRHGPAKKLEDWKQMRDGERLMLTPEPTDSDVQKAYTRCTYLRNKGVGRYKVEVEPDGSLWVRRHS